MPDERKLYMVCGLIWLTAFSLLQAQGVPSPQIEFKEMEFDFGLIKEGEKATHTYKFRNAGTDTLRIEKVHAS